MFPNLQELTEIHETGMLNSCIEELESVEYFQSNQALQADQRFLEHVRKTSPAWVSQSDALQIALKLLPFVDFLVVKNGADGLVLVATNSSSSSLPDMMFQILPGRPLGSFKPAEDHNPSQSTTTQGNQEIVNVTGAGDSLCASILTSVALHDPGQTHLAFDWDGVIDSAQKHDLCAHLPQAVYGIEC
ncbi:hypothetical protein MJO28_003627 [Puccinia striiformis f. sp. tritici]|uniref:Carbohydrate kinase PfkB domain-containing protein n=2 Tax=Puccinia striiformis TaxID=27350 RepID=A0A2S4VSC3_9BASI|nr:hypothetical protein MJO28_003627 [Puccinia striiformis f. sp. tritici]POW12280.1 hypothetical protein PSTT_04585 [Puccinia striiformis]